MNPLPMLRILMARRERLAKRFAAKVERKGPNECWRWLAGTVKNREGTLYGKFKLAGRTVYAHRFAAGLANAPGKIQAMHHCDNTLCVNPAHLFRGSASDNMIDARDKGRLHDIRGIDGRFLRKP